MVVGVGFCKIKVDSIFLLVLKIKCTKFHQDRSKTVDLHTKYANRHSVLYMYSAFFLTVAIGNCMVKLIPPVNFCSDENIQTIFGTRFEDFLNYRTEYNSIS
jgi:hypothetical protein